jgi:hypothetical protein
MYLFLFLQAGKLSQEEAYAIAQKIGLIAVPKVERTSSLSKSTQLFNFSVYKWSKGRTVQRLILQVCMYVCVQGFFRGEQAPPPENGLP